MPLLACRLLIFIFGFSSSRGSRSRSRLPDPSRQRIEGPRDLRTAQTGRFPTGNHHDVDVLGQYVATCPEPLPYAPLDAIPHDRVADAAAGADADPPVGWPPAWLERSDQHHEGLTWNPPAPPRDTSEVSRITQAVPAAQGPRAARRRAGDGHGHRLPGNFAPERRAITHRGPPRSRLLGGDRDREALAALRAPPLQDGPARAGLHPLSKSVLARPLDATRLIGPLHL